MTYSNQAELDAGLAEWQKRLRLQDWDIRAALKGSTDLESWGRNNVCFDHHTSYIRMRDAEGLLGCDWDAFGEPDHEAILVHELLHIHVDPFCPKDKDSHAFAMMEQAVNTLSHCLVAMKYETLPSGSRLENIHLPKDYKQKVEELRKPA